MNKLIVVINSLLTGEKLAAKYYDHTLSGLYKDCHECHIEPDWLLIYRVDNNELELILMRTGSHSSLFK
jgi:mRNA interferase YafQ